MPNAIAPHLGMRENATRHDGAQVAHMRQVIKILKQLRRHGATADRLQILLKPPKR